MVVFACKRKLIKSRLTDGLKIVTFCLALDRPENQLARSRRLKTSRIKVTEACQSLIGTFSTLRRCVIFGRMLHRRFYGAPGWACQRHKTIMISKRFSDEPSAPGVSPS